MKILFVAAVSKDGFIADENGDVTSWTSDEDKRFFAKIKSEYHLYVMGSKTYDKLPKPLQGNALRVVLTSNPKRYTKDTAHNVIFESLSPSSFVEKYSKPYSSCLLLGGNSLYQEFLDAELVAEIYLTIEPITLSTGTRFMPIDEYLSAGQFKEIASKVLNKNGSLLKHYAKEVAT